MNCPVCGHIMVRDVFYDNPDWVCPNKWCPSHKEVPYVPSINFEK